MSRLSELSAWTDTVSTNMPQLSRPQATVLAAWSFAMLLAQSVGLTACSALLAQLWAQPENTVRQRLREFYYEADAKCGPQRQAIAVSTCFAPLFRWLVSHWPASHPYLALALDATTLGDQLTVLSCAVLYRGCAIPVAWKVLPGNQKGAWRPHWLAMIAQLDSVVPSSWTVLVMADRALYARWLFERIVANGWHPFLRIQRQGNFRLAGGAAWRPINSLLPQAGSEWQGAVSCFKGANGRLDCTLLGRWEEGQTDPWLVVTDLAPEAADIVWYGLRFWIECGFKDLKRGGWQWQQTQIREPERVERQWLALAVATLLVVSQGGAGEENEALGTLASLPALVGARKVKRGGGSWRLVSCFRRGINRLLVQLLHGQAPDVAVFWPEDWPQAEQRQRLKWTVLAAEPVPQPAAA